MQAATAIQSFKPSKAGVIWLKLAVLYLICGVSLGVFMGTTQNFTMKGVHVHLNLLGWATVALAGLIYSVFPRAGESRLAKVHFWLHHTCVPVLMVSLAFLFTGHTQILPVLAVSEIGAALGIAVFAVNVFRNVGR